MTETISNCDLNIESLPDTLELWSCVGCGAVGNFAACTGICKFAKTEIVAAEHYADLLEASLAMREQLQFLDAVIRRLALDWQSQSDFESLYRQSQIEAKGALAAFLALACAIPTAIEGKVGSAEVWLCKTCGQVDAPQPCLGICVRRNGEHVRMEAFQALAAQAALERRALGQSFALLRRIRAVTPKAGQWEAAVDAFRLAAGRLLRGAHGSTESAPENGHPNSGENFCRK